MTSRRLQPPAGWRDVLDPSTFTRLAAVYADTSLARVAKRERVEELLRNIPGG